MVDTNIQPGQVKAINPIACYRFSETLLLELEEHHHTQGSQPPLEGIVIDLTEEGFALPMHHVFAFSAYATKVLAPLGVMVLLSKSAGIVLELNQDGTNLAIKCYRPADAIFAHWPFLTDLVRRNVPSYEHLQYGAHKTSIYSYMVRSIVPVLSEKGRQAKQNADAQNPLDFVLQTIDDFQDIGKICAAARLQRGMSEEKTISLLKALEANKSIYPIFSRLDFLVDCYTLQKSFRIGRYFIAAGLMSEGELVSLLERQNDLVAAGQKRRLLGQLAVESGYLNERYLTMLLQEQFTFGGHKARSASAGVTPAIGQFGDSLFGALGTIDSPGLLQSIASTQKPGLLSVESSRGILLICFDGGRMVAARMGRLFGLDAVHEFLVNWTEGIFLFREDLELEYLSEDAAIKANMNKVLLDAALMQDNIKALSTDFPRGLSTVFERGQDFEILWQSLARSDLKMYDDNLLPESDMAAALDMADMVDGLSTVEDIVLHNTVWPEYKSLYLLHFLYKKGLISIRDNAVFAAVRHLRTLSRGMAKIVGESDNQEMLLASLAQTKEHHPAAGSLQIMDDGSIFVEMGRLKAEGIPVSSVLEALKYLVSTYLAYGRRMNREMVDKLVGPSA